MRKFALFIIFISVCFAQNNDKQQYYFQDIQKKIKHIEFLKNKYAKNLKQAKYFFGVDEKIVNLINNNGEAFFVFKLYLGVENENHLKILDSVDPVVVDTIIKVASNKTFEEISTPKGKEVLSYEIAEHINAKINNIFHDDNKKNIVRYVFFEKFLIEYPDKELEERVERIEKFLKLGI